MANAISKKEQRTNIFKRTGTLLAIIFMTGSIPMVKNMPSIKGWWNRPIGKTNKKGAKRQCIRHKIAEYIPIKSKYFCFMSLY